MRRNGFTIVEILIATVIVVFTAGATFALLGSVTQFTGRRPHSYEAFNFATQTLDTLKNYVTRNFGDPKYQLTGDAAAGAGGECPGVGAASYALRDGPALNPETHRHPLPTGPGTLADDYQGERCYTVEDVDLNGDGTMDYKRVIVTVTWTSR